MDLMKLLEAHRIEKESLDQLKTLFYFVSKEMKALFALYKPQVHLVGSFLYQVTLEKNTCCDCILHFETSNVELIRKPSVSGPSHRRAAVLAEEGRQRPLLARLETRSYHSPQC